MKKNLILIVDDNPVNIQLLVNILESDYDLIVAKNGTKALQSITKHKPDLVLLDIKMPEMDGYQVCKKVKNNPLTKDIAIIFITAMSDSSDISKGFETGAVDYITKPFTAAEVKARVQTHLSLNEMRLNLSQQNTLLEQRVAEKTKDILHQAYYDSLTDLPNRKLLLDRLEQALITSSHHDYFGAIIYIGLDRFKSINDSLGHSIGDQIIIESAQRIKSCIFEEDTLSRFGGDEYVILLRHLANNKEQAGLAVNKVTSLIQDKFKKTYLIKTHQLYLTASFGISLFPSGHDTVEEIIKHADTAMYSSKENGRNQIAYYQSEMQQKIQIKLTLENDLRSAINKNELDVYYQPQIDSQGKLTAVEALIRWQHPQRGFINPEEFIAIAEDSGLIYEIGAFVLERSITDILEINSKFKMQLNLSVNISPHQFRKADFTHCIKTLIEKYLLTKYFLTLELTERVAVDNINETIKKIEELRLLGVRFSLDDFGTGYSSLSHLKQLPIDELKIDKSFTLDIESDPQDALLIQTIIKIGHQFNLDIVAEGVETQEQLSFLQKDNCTIYQGYFYSKALPLKELNDFINTTFVTANFVTTKP